VSIGRIHILGRLRWRIPFDVFISTIFTNPSFPGCRATILLKCQCIGGVFSSRNNTIVLIFESAFDSLVYLCRCWSWVTYSLDHLCQKCCCICVNNWYLIKRLTGWSDTSISGKLKIRRSKNELVLMAVTTPPTKIIGCLHIGSPQK